MLLPHLLFIVHGRGRKVHILLVDQEQQNLNYLKNFLTGLGHQVATADNGSKALDKYYKADFQLILAEVNIPVINGLDLLDKINQSKYPFKPQVILFSANADANCVIEALRKGVYDFLLNPINLEYLHMTINQAALNYNKKIPDFNSLTTPSKPVSLDMRQTNVPHILIDGIGPVFLNSPVVKQIYELAPLLHSDRGIPVLIEGETGTGKELVARYIHFENDSYDCYRPFVAINCSTLTHSLFESELFGYDAGAFTGAVSSGKRGKLDLAEGGTLFLDEIAELPLKLQAKLLRVIQEKKYYRLGGLKQIENDVRIICATNKNIEELVDKNRFRRDLFYRINTVYLKVPPLRERVADIIPLAQVFLKEFSKQRQKDFVSISDASAKLLRSHPWPGNIRQLRSVIDSVTLFHNDTILKEKHLDIIRGDPQIKNKNPVPAHSLDYIKFDLCADRLPLESINRDIITRALEIHNGNISNTARYLDISTRSLSYKLKKWDISRSNLK